MKTPTNSVVRVLFFERGYVQATMTRRQKGVAFG